MVKYLYGGNLLFRLDLSLGLISICLLACFIFSFLHGTWAVIDFDYESDGNRYKLKNGMTFAYLCSLLESGTLGMRLCVCMFRRGSR